MDVADWLCHASPQRLNDGVADELEGVYHWLKDSLSDICDDDIVSSLVEFTGKEFFCGSTPANGTSESLPALQQQPSTSSDPTSSAEEPSSSGAVCGGSGLGYFSRGSAVRSFSANDLQLLLEQPLGMFPAMAGLSAPPGGHMSRAGPKGSRAHGRPALESVPEGAPSQGGPLPLTSTLDIPPKSPPGIGLGSGAATPALGTSPGSAPYLPALPAIKPVTAASHSLVAPGAVMTGASAPDTAVSAGITPPYLGAAGSFTIGAYPLGLPLSMPSNVLPSHQPPTVAAAAAAPEHTVGRQAAAAVCGVPAVTTAAGVAGDGASAPAPKLRKSQSALELGAWRTTSLGSEGDGPEVVAAAAAATGAGGQKMIGRLTPEERLQRILRYRNKRNQRNFNREIKYQCRKTLADSRPRVGGRFARNDDPNSVLPHQTKKAMRMKVCAVAEVPAPGQSTPGVESEAGSGDGAIVTRAVAGNQRQQHLQQLQSHQQQVQQHQNRQAGAGGQVARGFPGGMIAVATSSHSTATTTSTNSEDHSAAATSAGTVAVVLPASASTAAAACIGSSLPYTAAPAAMPTPDGAGAPPPLAACLAGAVPHTYGMPVTMPYATRGAVPGGAVVLPHPGGVPMSVAGSLPVPAALDAAHMHSHYNLVTAAAQAAARGVYAHLGLATGLPSGSKTLATPGAIHMQAPALAQVNGAAGCYAIAAAAAPSGAAVAAADMYACEGDGAAGMRRGNAAGGGTAEAPLPPRPSSPMMDVMLPIMEVAALAEAVPQQKHQGSDVGGQSGSCMAMDG